MISLREIDLKNKKTIFLFVLISLSVAAALRLYQIDAKSLWYDELHSIIPTDPANSFSSVIEYSRSDQPPLFFLLLHSWFKIFPYNEVSGKVLCAIIGVLGVMAMYALGREVYGTRAAFAAMVVGTTNIFHIYYSQELRFYGLLFLVTCLSFLTFIKFVKVPDYKNQFLFILSSAAVLYTHYFGIVVVISQAILFVIIGIYYRKGFHFILKGATCAVIVMILFLPWLPTIVQDNQTSSFWIQDPGPFFFIDYFSRYFNGWWALSFKYLLNGLMLLMVLSYVLLLIKDLKNKPQQETSTHHTVIIGWLFLTLIIPYLYTVLKLPMLIDRYTIITLPAIFLMVAIGYVRIQNRYIKILIVLIFIVLNVRVYHRYYNKYKKPEYRELASQIIHHSDKPLPILSRHAWQFSYYFKKYKASNELLKVDTINSKWFNEQEKFWVIFTEDVDSVQKAELQANFEIETRLEFYAVDATLYRRKE